MTFIHNNSIVYAAVLFVLLLCLSAPSFSSDTCVKRRFGRPNSTEAASDDDDATSRPRRLPHSLLFARAFPQATATPLLLPPAIPAAPWQTLNESLLPYPIFYAATAVLDNSVVVLGGCLTASCATPVGRTEQGVTAAAVAAARHSRASLGENVSARSATTISEKNRWSRRKGHDTSEAAPSAPAQWTDTGSPYHERSVALEVERQTMTPLPQLTLPDGLGFAGRHAAVTLTDSIYVPRSCTMTTLSPHDIATLSEKDLTELQAFYAPIVALYPESKKKKRRAPHPDRSAAPSVNLSYFEVPAERVRVNASCTALATENKILIMGGFLLSSQQVTASVDAFNVVTRKYESEVVFLSMPVLQPSVAASTGFAAVAGGWTYETAEVNTPATARASPSPVPSRPVIHYLFDLLFFEGDRWSLRRSISRQHRLHSANAPLTSSSSICVFSVDPEQLPRDAVQRILLAEQGCHVEVFGGQVVLTDHNLGNIAVLDVRATSAPAVFAGGRELLARALFNPPSSPQPQTSHTTKMSKESGNHGGEKRAAGVITVSVVASRLSSSESLSASSSSSSPSSDSSPAPSPSPTPPTPPPPKPVYHYRWERPMLITLPLTRERAAAVKVAAARETSNDTTTTTTTTESPTSTSAPDVDTITDTILVFMALGGEDVWTQEVPDTEAALATTASLNRARAANRVEKLSMFSGYASSSDLHPHHEDDVVVRRAAAQRWAQRYVPDPTYDAARGDLLAVKMPTPIWPEGLTLQTTAEGTIHLDFPSVNYTKYCLWESHQRDETGYGEGDNAEEEVVCAVRLSSRRDCVGNTAGTLDAPYNGAPNTSAAFSASGSTMPVYVCFSYVVQPTLWSTCGAQRSFSVLNPMMPLRILDNTPTLPPPPSPTPSRDPSDKTTSSPLFIFAVGISVVTLMVAVLLVARLQHVPEEGLLVEDFFSRGDGRSGGAYTRVAGRDVEANGVEEDAAAAAVSQADTATCPRGPLTRLDAFQHLVATVAENNEARMLDAAAEVLRLHQHRYRVLSRVGQSDHTLCFLALRKPTPTATAQPAFTLSDGGHVSAAAVGGGMNYASAGGLNSGSLFGRRGVPRFPVSSIVPAALHTAGGRSSSSNNNNGDNYYNRQPSASTSSSSSLWAARYDQRAAVVVKYTQCPDDTTRGVITRLCERLRDLQACGGGLHSFASVSNSSRDSRTSSGAAALGWMSDSQQQQQQHQRFPHPQSHSSYVPSSNRRTPPPSAVTSRVVSGMSAAPAQGAASTGAPTLTRNPYLNAAEERPRGSVDTHTERRESMLGSQQSEYAFSTTSAAAVAARAHAGAVRAASEETEEESPCAWLDAHEVDVAISLFLLLPADLFVSYEVSVLQQQQQQHQRGAEMGRAMSAGHVRQAATLFRTTAQWNQQCVYIGQSCRQSTPSHHRHSSSSGGEVVEKGKSELRSEAARSLDHSIRDRLGMRKRRGNDEATREAVAKSGRPRRRLTPAARAFLTSLTSHAPRVCWDACVNPLQPTTVSPWSLCLVMPYERAGDLADFVRRAQHVLPADAWQASAYWGCANEGKESSCGSGVSSPLLALPRARHCWTESLLCSLLFQLGAGLQLLHQQSPPILQGDLKATNVLLREPTTFSVSRRRVHYASTAVMNSSGSGGGSDIAGIGPTSFPGVERPSQPPPPPPLPRGTSGSYAPEASTDDAASGFSARPADMGSPLLPRFTATTTDRSEEDQQQSTSSTKLLPPPPEWYLSTKSYLAVSLTDGGMSWWLTVQLPQRLRGCFGFTTQSTLRQTQAGRCWRSRYHAHTQRQQQQQPRQESDEQIIDEGAPPSAAVAAAPSEESIAGLAHFLFCFVEVPCHIAPELIWGQLCHLSSAVVVASVAASHDCGAGTFHPRHSRGSPRRRGASSTKMPKAGGCRDSGTHTDQHQQLPTAPPPPDGDPPSASQQHAVVFVAVDPGTHVHVNEPVDKGDRSPLVNASAAPCSYSRRRGQRESAGAGATSRDLVDDLMFDNAFADEEEANDDANSELREQAQAQEDGEEEEEQVETSESEEVESAEKDDVVDSDEEDDDDEEGVFTTEEVSLLTSTMWKAEGLTRVTRHPPPPPPQQQQQSMHERGPSAATAATEGSANDNGLNTSAASLPAASRTRDAPSSLSDTSPINNGATPPPPGCGNANVTSPPPLVASALPFGFPPSGPPFAPLHPAHTAYRSTKCLGMSSMYNNTGEGAGGSQSSSSVYEVLIQRVLAMDTASDVWSLGALLYGMCTDALRSEDSTADSAVVSGTCTLAQRAFAALLGDLFAMSCGLSPAEEKSETKARRSEEACFSHDDRARWPRSCALEDEVAAAFTSAGYRSTFSRLLSRMLSPVAARRPSAADIVEQVRLVVFPTAAASPTMTNGSPLMTTLAEPHHAVARSDALNNDSRGEHTAHVSLFRDTAGGGVGGVPAVAVESDSVHTGRTAAAAVLLDERNATMELRQGDWY